MSFNPAVKEQDLTKESLSQEAVQILDILDQIENHTAALRKKLMSELRPKNEAVHIKLDNV